jgi:hypothetical protein
LGIAPVPHEWPTAESAAGNAAYHDRRRLQKLQNACQVALT